MAALIQGVPPRLTLARGFTLTEIAIVLFIVALLLGSMMLPIAAQENIRRTQESQRILAEARDVLIGFATANGRLPCPATAASNGLESFAGGGSQANGLCSNPHDGLLPAAQLGLASTDNLGRLLDGWSNPIRYGITTANNSAFTTTNGMATVGMANLAPDLRICASSPGGAALALGQCADPETVNVLSNGAVAVLYSTGPNGATGGAGIDETHNPNPGAAIAADRVYISHAQAETGSANGEFDDLVVWLSPNILINRMVAAGTLP